VIEEYPDDTPYPSRLILGWNGTKPLHVVIADNNEDKETIIITAYEPNQNQIIMKIKKLSLLQHTNRTKTNGNLDLRGGN